MSLSYQNCVETVLEACKFIDQVMELYPWSKVSKKSGVCRTKSGGRETGKKQEKNCENRVYQHQSPM